MYKLIIVDDEISTHELLKDYIENVIGEFEVVGCFKDGSEAIKFLNNNHVDVVITDIKMPKVSGLELAKYIYENNPLIKVVIVSGYGEFEYAKEAISYNVSDYLLKAIDLRELTKVLKKIETQLHETKKTTYDVDYVTQREGFCTDLIVGALGNDEIEIEYEKCNMPYQINDAKIALYKCRFLNYKDVLDKRWNYDAEYFSDAINGILQSVVNEHVGGVVVEINKHDDYMIVAIITDFVISGIEKKLEENLRDIMILDSEIIKITDFCGIYETGNYSNVFDENELCKIMISYVKMYGTKNAQRVINRVIELMNNDTEELMISTGVQSNSDNPDEVAYNVSGVKPDKDEIIDKAKEYINKNYMKDISYTDVADELYFNAVYFSRYFKQRTGITLGDYILEIRMKKAIEYLSTDIKISEIPSLCGYKNTRTFQRIFKNYTGYSATDYKKLVLKNT